MKKHLFLAAFAFTLFTSCSSRSTDQTEAMPYPPDEESNFYPRLMKRGSKDIVEILYAKAISNAEDLQVLQQRLDHLPYEVDDSIGASRKFASINDDYYTSVATRIDHIRDTLLKRQIQSVVNQSKQRYSSKVSTYAALTTDINRKQRAIHDLHNALKVLLTLPLIQEYQDKSKPSTMPLESLIIEMEKLRVEMDTLRMKNGR